MQFGLYAPVPHVTVGSPRMAQSIAGAAEPLPDGVADPGFELARDVLMEADAQGFDIILFAERHLGTDLEAWILAAAIAPLTRRIKAMVAVHPSLWHPELIAKMASSLDRIGRGRMCLNLVTGWNVEEHRMYGGGDIEYNDDRYVKAEEFIDVVRGMWRETPFTYHGKHFPVDAAKLLLKPASREPPDVFTAARSERGLEMVARVGDWWFVDYDKRVTNADEYFEGVKRAIADMRTRAARNGRKVRFALNPFVAFGDSNAAAMDEVRRVLSGPDDDQRKILSRIGPATLAGCIGRAQDIRARLRAFADLGVEFFLFKFVPDVEMVRRIGDDLIRPLRDKAAPAAE